MEKRPNFYIILDIDPSITDWSTIQATIQSKRRSWSMQKNQGSPTARRKAERYLKFIPEMEVLLKEPDNCKKEAQAAIREQKQAKQVQFKELDELIKILNTNTVSTDDIKLLVRQTGISEKEVEERLKQRGIYLETTTKTSSKLEFLEASVAKGIRDELNSLKLNSLYEFLNLEHSPKFTNRSSPKSLYERADEIYKDLSRIGKTDTDTTLKMGLAGRAKSVFVNNKEKERYDNTLSAEILIKLDNPLEIVGRNKFIDTKGINSLLQEAKKLGATEAAAINYIEKYAEKRHWTIQVETKIPKLAICGYCNTLATSEQDKRCRNCGEELIQDCPKCGNPTLTEDNACNNCGCHTGDAPLVKSLLKDGKQLMQEGDVEQAISYFNRVLDYWPNWQLALAEKQQAELKKQEYAKKLNAIKGLIKAKKFVAGKALLEQFENNKTLEKQINDGLERAEQVYKLAEKLRLSGKDAFDKYEESLSYCVDFSSSLSAIANNPPPAPQNITAKWLTKSLRLSWSEVKGKISYHVIRKSGGLPINERDGDIIAETSVNTIDDTTIKSGITYYYSVFSIRAGITSYKFISTGPHLKTTDVEEIDYEIGDRQVTIKWQLPTGCIAVEIWRQKNSVPKCRGEGKIFISSSNYLLDTDLQNGQCYGYLIFAQYQHSENETILYSKGISFIATPISPPKPITDLAETHDKHTVFLTWTIPNDKIQVQIRQTQSIPNVTTGQIVSNIEKIGKPVQITAKDKAQVTLNTQGRVFFVPLTIIAKTAVVGNIISITTIDDISNLKSQCNGRNIILTWDWPTGASEVLVTYHHNYFPKYPEDNGITKIPVTSSEYQRNNCWELRSTIQKKHYFTIFIKDPTANIYSNGIKLLEPMGQEHIVSYKVVVKKPWFGKKTAWIEFTSEEDTPLEGLQVVRKNKYPPISKNDGIFVANIDRIIFMDKRAKFEIPNIKESGYLKVFFKDDSYAKEVRLLPATKDKLKI